MKKVLATVLAVIMIFATLSLGVSAGFDTSDMTGDTALEDGQRVLHFVTNSCTLVGVWVYDFNEDGKGFEFKSTYKGEDYYMLPDNRYFTAEDRITGKLPHMPGTSVTLPSVTPPSGSTFNGWQLVSTGETYAAGAKYYIPYDSDKVITFRAYLVPKELEEDTMGGVMDILVKVFGSIVGLLFFSDQGTDAIDEGMKLMQKLIGGLFE